MLDCILCVESVLCNQSATEANVCSAVMNILKYAKYRKGAVGQRLLRVRPHRVQQCRHRVGRLLRPRTPRSVDLDYVLIASFFNSLITKVALDT